VQLAQPLRLGTYEAILEACCNAWNELMVKSDIITSIAARESARVKI
jgi:hypothetical protein